MRDSRFFLTSILGLAILVCIIVPSFAGDGVPVLLWDGSDSGDSSPDKLFSPLAMMSQAEFKKTLEKRLGDGQPPIIVFESDNLCVDDLTQHRKELKQIMEFGSMEYIPLVASPHSVFASLPFYNVSWVDEVESVSEGQLIFTKALDLDSVPDTFKLVRERNLIAALTGKSCNFNRSERIKRAAETAPGNETKSFIVETDRFLFYADKSPMLKFDSPEFIDLGDLTKNVTEEGAGTSDSPLVVKMEFKAGNESASFRVGFAFEITAKGGYYSLQRVNISRDDKYNNSLLTRSDIVWPYNFSYHCLENITFANKTAGISLSFFNMQMQLDTKRFGDAYDCVGFTTIPIWSSIFVTGILAIIMIWGLTMIMDIRTMDRFDDPKGKTITISAQE